MNVQQLENELWEAADKLRANGKLTASQYSKPVLGLIFLRHAENRFDTYLPEILAAIPPEIPASQREESIKLGFQGKAAIYLPESARFSYISNLPQGNHVGEVIDAAMSQIEQDHPTLSGALPRDYSGFDPELLADLLKIFDRPAIKTAQGDVFGRIYEYFLNKFAMTGAQEGGEFFTPPSLVRMIVNIIEPDHGTVLDPACGSAGMFVQTGHFIGQHRKTDINRTVTFFGQEKSEDNSKLARMNMVVHGLDAQNIKQGNTFYEQMDHLIGQSDFVMANPPFNVDGVDTKKVEGQATESGRLPFGLPGTNAKTGAISNANSLWLQYFYSYLNETGRAGFVMASSASDAGNKDRDIREQLVKTGHVDVMMSIGNKFFYTRSLPCTLWFYDKGKPEDLRDQVLMIDARNVYHVVSARSHVFTEEQLANLNAIVWLYRGEQEKFIRLVADYHQQVAQWLTTLPSRLDADSQAIERLSGLLQKFSDDVTLAELNRDQPVSALLEQGALDTFRQELVQLRAEKHTAASIAQLLSVSAEARDAIDRTNHQQHSSQVTLQTTLEALVPQLKAVAKEMEARHKQWLKLLDTAEKNLRARMSKAFDGKAVREAKRALLAADSKKDEMPSVRDQALDALKQAACFIHQVHWLHSRFPHALFENVLGLCKAVTVDEISSNDFSLTPGRYVGVAPAGAEDEDDFVEKMRAIHNELAELNANAVELAARINCNFGELFG